MSRIIIVYLVFLPLSLFARTKVELESIQITYPNTRSSLKITLSKNKEQIEINYQGKKKIFSNKISLMIESRYQKLLKLMVSNKSEINCITSTTWAVKSTMHKRRYCLNRKVIKELGVFQQSIQMLMY